LYEETNIKDVRLSILPFYADIFEFLDRSVLDNSKLRELHKNVWQQDTFGWFNGQILKYLLRPNEKYNKIMKTIESELELEKHRPIVGLQVRRGNKILESKYIKLEEYMKYAEDFFYKYYSMNPNKIKEAQKKTIFLATDEPQVLTEAIKR
jgi:hypothetical protein